MATDPSTIFSHLLPKARAWLLTPNKQLREFFTGLTDLITDIKTFFDNIFSDIDPQQTRELPAWESQFALRDTGITEQERRDRLAATWQALVGGQSPGYIQDTLRANGFDVYVHDWWTPGTEPAPGVKACVTPRDPLTLLVSPAYPLVNKVLSSEKVIIMQAGEAIAQAGEPEALSGNYLEFEEVRREYFVPVDSTKWPYFVYVGGATFGTFANVPTARRDEFEDLCLKICPAHLWIGLFVLYV